MKKRKIFICAMLLAMLFIDIIVIMHTETGIMESSTGKKSLASSPWPMFHHGLNHTGRSEYNTSNNGATLKWKFQTGDDVKSSPAIGSDGTIYVGSMDHYLYAINPDGTLKWKFQTGSWVFSSPAIDSDGTIYVGSGDDYLYAINPDGTLKWKFQTGDVVYSSPAISGDGIIYVGSEDGYLYAINPDGTLKWKFQTGDQILSSPAIGSDGTIYIGSRDHYLYAIGSQLVPEFSSPIVEIVAPLLLLVAVIIRKFPKM